MFPHEIPVAGPTAAITDHEPLVSEPAEGKIVPHLFISNVGQQAGQPVLLLPGLHAESDGVGELDGLPQQLGLSGEGVHYQSLEMDGDDGLDSTWLTGYLVMMVRFEMVDFTPSTSKNTFSLSCKESSSYYTLNLAT